MPYKMQTEVFNIRDGYEDVDWEALKQNCEHLSNWGIVTFRSGFDGLVKSILLEKNYICKDHRDLFSNYYSKKYKIKSHYCDRLHFFSEEIELNRLLLKPEEFQEAYIGYSVIRPVYERCIGRTVIDPFKVNKDMCCLRTSFGTEIAGAEFKVEGYPYISQDAEVTVCAHSSLWGVCRYLSERYSKYREVYPYDLVLMTGDHHGRKAPYRGMTYSDYSTILTKFGCHPIVKLTKKEGSDKIDSEAFKDVCAYVESGFPVLASIGRHVVTLVGHTIDYTKTVGSSDVIDSSEFLKQFVVVDDNVFPYSLLGYENDPDNYGKLYQNELGVKSINSIAAAVCPLPEKVFLPAKKARYKAEKFLKKLKPDADKIASGPYITRLFLTSGSSFKKKKRANSLNTSKLNADTKLDIVSYWLTRNLSFPHFIWVMEISTIELYKKGLCFGEIVLDSTESCLENTNIYLRIGNKLWYDGESFEVKESATSFRQYKHNLGE